MTLRRVTGIFTPIITPFHDDDTVDETALTSNVARWMTTPLTGLVVLGSNGEAAQLDDDESDRVVDIVRAAVPRDRPLIVGSGRESTRGTIAATRRAAAAGADAVLVRTPSFFKSQMTSDALVRHYTAVADAATVPVLLYNVSMYTGVSLQPDAVERLAQHPNIIGMKESGSDIGLIAEFVSRTPDDFTVLAGSATTLFLSLCAGCDGAVLALASLVPQACVEMRTLVAQNKIAEARAMQRRLLPIARSVGGTYGIAGLKAALDMMGYHGGAVRPPLQPLSAQPLEIIRGQLDALGVLAAAKV